MTTTQDPTEGLRHLRLVEINGTVRSRDPLVERRRLEAQYGYVWDPMQLGVEFKILGFAAPYVVVRRKADGLRGSLEFQNRPRFYFNLVIDE